MNIHADGEVTVPSAFRRQQVLARVQREAFVSSREIATKMGVSVMTVRRDIDALSQVALVQKVRGGAARVSGMRLDYYRSGSELALITEASRHADRALTIGLVAGPLAAGLAAALGRVPGLTFITNSIEAFEALSALHRISELAGVAILLPGLVARDPVTIGPLCVTTLAGIHIDVTYVCVSGFDADTASFSAAVQNVEVIRAFARSSHRTIAIAPSASWSARSTAAIGSSVIDVIITDAAPGTKDRVAIAAAGMDLAIIC